MCTELLLALALSLGLSLDEIKNEYQEQDQAAIAERWTYATCMITKYCWMSEEEIKQTGNQQKRARNSMKKKGYIVPEFNDICSTARFPDRDKKAKDKRDKVRKKNEIGNG